jgi:6,7-dimethyl-8-ribityllumazine synthase
MSSSHEQSYRIGVVTGRFNREVTERLQHGCIKKLREMGIAEEDIADVTVPGAFEIPLAAQTLLESGCDGVVALGAIIRGETSHYDYVCSAVERGCTELQLKFGKPVTFGVLTTENEEQAFDRVGGKHGHKGEEAAAVCIEMIELIKNIRRASQARGSTQKK